MKEVILTLFFLITNISITLANGGPIDVTYFKKTGNIRLLQKADVSLIKEDLKIKIIHDTTFIEVKYLLRNNGVSQTIHYGFPVDLYDTTHWNGQIFIRKGYERINYFRAFLGGKPIQHAYWEQGNAYTANMYRRGSLTKNVPVHRHWHQLNLFFEENDTRELSIEYAVCNRKIDGLGGLNFLPYTTDRFFVYDLFPSSKWSDGIVQDFSISLDLSQLKSNGYKYNISGLEKLQIDKDSSGIYSLTFKNFDLKTRSFIGVRYSNYDFVKAYYVQEKFSPLQPISVASSAPNAEYLIDGDPKSVWKGKEGDWILLRFPILSYKSMLDSTMLAPINPAGFLILNGDYSSEEQFLSSPKVKSIQLKINNCLIGRTNFNKAKSGTGFFIDLEQPRWYFSDNNRLRVAQSPLNLSFEDAMRFTNGSAYKTQGSWKMRVETIAIYITKSASGSKEVVISELYFFKKNYLRQKIIYTKN